MTSTCRLPWLSKSQLAGGGGLGLAAGGGALGLPAGGGGLGLAADGGLGLAAGGLWQKKKLLLAAGRLARLFVPLAKKISGQSQAGKNEPTCAEKKATCCCQH
ncbi:hypothetical protein PR002_g13262 [Phytophthora rubi]|uniref:Uncharacterized protein n=1 Tax=Phytophthora rubi TaxID=129364 RepID=A0A6A3LNX0_9STRA|nr:hypothetical protein PR002_g13262 [Phytophthora rubi]